MHLCRHSSTAQPQACRKCSGKCVSRRSCSWGAGARAAPEPPCMDVLTARHPARRLLACSVRLERKCTPPHIALSPAMRITSRGQPAGKCVCRAHTVTVHMHAWMAHEGRKAAGIQSCSHCVCRTLLQSAAAPLLQVTPSKCKTVPDT
jgi:hypothetical protein